MKILERFGPTLLVCFSIGISIVLAYTATKRSLTIFETVLWQIFVFAGGLTGSYIFGKRSAQEAGKEIIKPHARNAVRQLKSLYKSISLTLSVISSSKNLETPQDYYSIRAYLIGVIAQQMATADDAIKNWHDILKEELEDLIKELSQERTSQEEIEELMQTLIPEKTLEDK